MKGGRNFATAKGMGGGLVLYLWRRARALTLKTLAEAATMRGEASVAVALKRYEKRLARDRGEQKLLERATQLLSC